MAQKCHNYPLFTSALQGSHISFTQLYRGFTKLGSTLSVKLYLFLKLAWGRLHLKAVFRLAGDNQGAKSFVVGAGIIIIKPHT
jgi:hypothetical protein